MVCDPGSSLLSIPGPPNNNASSSSTEFKYTTVDCCLRQLDLPVSPTASTFPTRVAFAEVYACGSSPRALPNYSS